MKKDIGILVVLIALIAFLSNPDFYPSRPVSPADVSTVSFAEIGASIWEQVSIVVKRTGEVLMMFYPYIFQPILVVMLILQSLHILINFRHMRARKRQRLEGNT